MHPIEPNRMNESSCDSLELPPFPRGIEPGGAPPDQASPALPSFVEFTIINMDPFRIRHDPDADEEPETPSRGIRLDY